MASFAMLALFGAGCWFGASTGPTNTPPVTVPPTQTPPVATPPVATPPVTTGTPPTKPPASLTSVLVSTQETTKYCNGQDMDSNGYRATITKQIPLTMPSNQTPSEEAKAVIVAGTSGQCQNIMKQLDIKRNDGTVMIPPIDGFAGVSIMMCYCQPQVEVNALRIPGVTKVVWQQP